MHCLKHTYVTESAIDWSTYQSFMQGSIKERLLFHLGQTNNLSYLCNVETNILTYFYCDEHIIVVKSPNQFSSSPSSSTTPSAALVFSCLFLEDETSIFLDPREDQDRGFLGADKLEGTIFSGRSPDNKANTSCYFPLLFDCSMSIQIILSFGKDWERCVGQFPFWRLSQWVSFRQARSLTVCYPR